MWICDRRLYRSIDGRKIVEEKDVRARTLIAAPGDEMKEKPVIEKMDTGQKAVKPGENKALKPGENKVLKPGESKEKSKNPATTAPDDPTDEPADDYPEE